MTRLVGLTIPGIPIENDPTKLRVGNWVLVQLEPDYWYVRYRLIRILDDDKFVLDYRGHHKTVRIEKLLSIIDYDTCSSLELRNP
jgi:hypothetical protein